MSAKDFDILPLFGDLPLDTPPVRTKPSGRKSPRYYVPICLVIPLGQISVSKFIQEAIGDHQLPRTSIRQLSNIPADGIISMLHDDILPVVRKGGNFECLDGFDVLGKAKYLLGADVKVPVAAYSIPEEKEQIKFAALRCAKRLLEKTGEVEIAAGMLARLTASGYLTITKKVVLADALGVSLSTLRNFDLARTLEDAGTKRKRGGKRVNYDVDVSTELESTRRVER